MDENKLISSLKHAADDRIPASTNIWPEIKSRLTSPPSKGLNKAWSAVVAGFLVIVLLFFTIPSVRAYLEFVYETIIGELSYTITDKYPWDGPHRTVPSEFMPLEQAQSQYNFVLPEWVPVGHELEPVVRVSYFGENGEIPFIKLTWADSELRGGIRLTVSSPPVGDIIGITTIQTLDINGQEVAYWMGVWNSEAKAWDEDMGDHTLSWSMDNLGYSLNAQTSIPLDDLTKMVESMLP